MTHDQICASGVDFQYGVTGRLILPVAVSGHVLIDHRYESYNRFWQSELANHREMVKPAPPILLTFEEEIEKLASFDPLAEFFKKEKQKTINDNSCIY